MSTASNLPRPAATARLRAGGLDTTSRVGSGTVGRGVVESRMDKHPIGSTVYHNGTPVTIATEPYILYGAEWQDGTAPNGRVVTVATPASEEASGAQRREERRHEQEGWRRLRAAEVSREVRQ